MQHTLKLQNVLRCCGMFKNDDRVCNALCERVRSPKLAKRGHGGRRIAFTLKTVDVGVNL